MPVISKNFKLLSTLKYKFIDILCRLQFLIQCRNSNVYPQCANLKFNTLRLKCFHHLRMNFQKQLLCNIIRNVRKDLAFTERRLYLQYLVTSKEMSSNFDKFYASTCCISETRYNRLKVKYHKKLEFLKNKQSNQALLNTKTDDNNIINLSNLKLDTITTKAINRGLNYSYNQKIPSLKKVIPEFEQSISKVPMDMKDSLRNLCLSEYNNHKKKNITSYSHQDINELKSLNNLKNNKNVKILKSDKTKQIVLLDIDDYNRKILKCLDELKVEKLDFDPTNKLLNSIHNLRNSKINKPFDFNIPLYPSAPRLYFTIKSHKENMPLRPIVTCFHKPTFFLEKHLASYLKPLILDHQYTIKSSEDLLNKVKDIKLSPTSKLYSFDVISLFPNLPMDTCIELIIEKLRNSPDLCIYSDYIRRSLNLIITHNYFILNNQIYIQKQGTAIGSPLSPILAEIVLQDLEKKILTPAILKPLCFYRYVDDCFAIWNYRKSTLVKLLESMNNYHTNIKFTVESEKNKILNFLDLQISRTNDVLCFDIYKKETFTNPLIPYSSNCPNNYKYSTIRSYINRARSHTKYRFQERREILKITDLALSKGYPMYIIKRLIRKTMENITSTTLMKDSDIKYASSISYFPFYQKIVNIIRNKCKIIIPYKNPKQVSWILTSDNVTDLSTGGVYSIPIHNEDDTTVYYIGRTRRQLKKRIQEHKNSLIKHCGNTMLKNYLFDNKTSKPLWDEIKILTAPSTDFLLNICEAVEIVVNEKHCINKLICGTLSDFWTTNLKKF